MLRLCPHHGLEKWLTIHTLYNGLTCMTNITVDAAAGGALMNKDFTIAYAFLEDMSLNEYHWTDEKTLTISSPSKKVAGMNEISSFDHLSAKVDALSKRFDNISAVTPTSVLSPCGACSIFGHTSIDCKPGGVIENIEQLNFVPNNQGTSSSKTFYRNFQNPFGQKTTLPGYVNNQSVIQKSSLDFFMENYFSNQTEQLQELEDQTRLLNDSLAKISPNIDFIPSHDKILEKNAVPSFKINCHPSLKILVVFPYLVS